MTTEFSACAVLLCAFSNTVAEFCALDFAIKQARDRVMVGGKPLMGQLTPILILKKIQMAGVTEARIILCL